MIADLAGTGGAKQDEIEIAKRAEQPAENAVRDYAGRAPGQADFYVFEPNGCYLSSLTRVFHELIQSWVRS